MTARFVRGFKIAWSAASGQILLTVGLTLIQGILPLAALYFLKLAIDHLSHGTTGAHVAGAEKLAGLIALSGVMYLLSSLVRMAGVYVNESLSLRVIEHVQELVAAKSNWVELSYYEDPAYFDTLHQAQREAPHRLGRLIGSCTQVIQSGFAFCAVAGLLLFSLDWRIVLAGAAISIPLVLLRLRHARFQYQWQRTQTPTERQVHYYEWLLSSTGAAKECRLFALGPVFAERAAALRKVLRTERLGLLLRRLIAEGSSHVIGTVAATAIVGHMAFQALRGLLTVGDVVLNFQAFQRGIAAFQELIGGISAVYENNLFIGRLFQFLDLPGPQTEVAALSSFPRPLRRGIKFHNVEFSYRGSDTKILDGVSFHIEPGQMVALVGENGAGKSTLVKLLCGLYQPTAGRITFDGVDIRSIERRDFWAACSVLFQDFGQYYVSALENISFGDIARGSDQDGIRAAAQKAGVDELIANFPRGYHQILGPLFEGGQELSVGQWQKIALARAFYRETPLIILDEPSSSLDVKAEHEVFQQFKLLTKGRTSIIISHRLSTVRMADRIFVLENGRLTETGSHDELMTSGGAYAELFETQASAYR